MVQHYKPFWLYFPAFAVVLFGLVIYFWHSTRTSSLAIPTSLTDEVMTAEEQGKTNVQTPQYVTRNRRTEEDAEAQDPGSPKIAPSSPKVVPSSSKVAPVVK